MRTDSTDSIFQILSLILALEIYQAGFQEIQPGLRPLEVYTLGSNITLSLGRGSKGGGGGLVKDTINNLKTKMSNLARNT